jgi:hypothetical protein
LSKAALVLHHMSLEFAHYPQQEEPLAFAPHAIRSRARGLGEQLGAVGNAPVSGSADGGAVSQRRSARFVDAGSAGRRGLGSFCSPAQQEHLQRLEEVSQKFLSQ